LVGVQGQWKILLLTQWLTDILLNILFYEEKVVNF